MQPRHSGEPPCGSPPACDAWPARLSVVAAAGGRRLDGRTAWKVALNRRCPVALLRLGVPRDFVTAAPYYQQSADLNDGYAMRFLANMYEVGMLGKPDLEKAGALRLLAQRVDPDGRQADPISVFRKIYAASQSHGQARPVVRHRRCVVYRRRLFLGCSWTWC